LTAGTYRLRGTVGTIVGSTADSRVGYGWYNETTSAWVGEGAGWSSPGAGNYNTTTSGTAEYVITVASTTVVSLRVTYVLNVSSIGGNAADFGAPYANPWIDIEQMGATFALNALDTISTTGNVTVGGNLSVTGAATIGATKIYSWPGNGASSGYVNLGTWTTTSNAGQMLDIKMTLHNGYNANPGQIQVVESIFMLSNGSTAATTGSNTVVTGTVLGTGVATTFSKLGNATAISTLVLVQNSTTSYTIWVQGVVAYTDNSMYQVVYGGGSTWTNSGTFQTGAPSYGSNYVVITPQTT